MRPASMRPAMSAHGRRHGGYGWRVEAAARVERSPARPILTLRDDRVELTCSRLTRHRGREVRRRAPVLGRELERGGKLEETLDLDVKIVGPDTDGSGLIDELVGYRSR